MTLADGRSLGWMELGNPKGWPVFGFHGTPGTRFQVAPDVAAVDRSGVRLIVLDRPGYGLSSFKKDRRLSDWPRDVAELADHIGVGRFSVFGVSGGGPHSAACAALLDDRVAVAGIVSGVASSTESLDEVGTMPINKLVTRLAQRRSPLLRLLTSLQVAVMQRWPERAANAMKRQLPPADRKIVERPELMELLVRDARDVSRNAGRAAAQDMELFTGDWGFDVRAITIPVHIFHGDADKTVPISHGRFFHDAIKDSTLHEYAGEGHFLVIDRIEEILRALKSK
jgi:pimeloyl-ACP methyl ester carboxylesterase